MWAEILAVFILSFLNCLEGAPIVPCFFVFGDSINDNGNNNNMRTLVKANFPPNGIDLPGHMTGRFCNGWTPSDHLVKLLGFDEILLPYANASGEAILRGLNYASGGAGILDETGKQFGAISRFSDQVKHHGEAVLRTKKIFEGNETAALSHLSKCLYHLQLGANDYHVNYFDPKLYSSSRRYNPELFADLLIRTYTVEIRTLYEYGARKMILFGVGQIGCMPSILASSHQTGSQCIEDFHGPVRIFNDKLKSLVDDLNRYYPDSKFIYADTFGSFQELLDRPSTYGFTVTNEGCCGLGRNHGKVSCIPNQVPCRDRNQYLFWDAYHLTDAANFAVVQRLLDRDSGKSFAYPMTVLELAKL